MIKNSRLTLEFFRSKFFQLIIIATFIVCVMNREYYWLRESHIDFFYFILTNKAMIYVFIFIPWFYFWSKKFGDNVKLELIREKGYFTYLAKIMKSVFETAFITISIILVIILLFSLINKFIGPSEEITHYMNIYEDNKYTFALRDSLGYMSIIIMSIYLILGLFFITFLLFIIQNRFSENISKLIIIGMLLLLISGIVVSNPVASLEKLNFMWIIFPNFYLSFYYAYDAVGSLTPTYVVIVEIVVSLYFAYRIKKEKIYWFRRT